MIAPTERKNSLTARNGGLTWPEDHFPDHFFTCKPVHAQEEGNGPSGADQGFFTAKAQK